MAGEELSDQPITVIVPEGEADKRLDAYLAQEFQRYSRMQLRRVIVAGGVQVNGLRTKVSHRLAVGDSICITLPEMPPAGPNPENIPLDVLHEDDHLIVINKPPGMVVHPARGHWSGTLTSALAFHFDTLSTAGGDNRPGIVHRLDRDTSGVMVVAKTDEAHFRLSEQFANRTTEKEYFAIIAGVPDKDRDWIDAPIGVHPYQREKMAIRGGHATSREANTFFEIQERFAAFCTLKVLPKTGRTHQIRVHMAHVGHPILCDRLYGGRAEISRRQLLSRYSAEDADEPVLTRQALHARRIVVEHPITKQELEFIAPIPADIQFLLDILRAKK